MDHGLIYTTDQIDHHLVVLEYEKNETQNNITPTYRKSNWKIIEIYEKYIPLTHTHDVTMLSR